MAFQSVFYETNANTPESLVTATKWASGHPYVGQSKYGVVGANDFAMTPHPTLPYTLNFTGGKAWGRGVFDTETGTTTKTAGPLASGQTRWDLVSLRRDWSAGPGKLTEITIVPGSATRAIPAGRLQLNAPSVLKDDQPLYLVQWTGGQTKPTATVDLRVFGGTIANSDLVLQYMDDLGTSIQIAGIQWDRVLGPNNTPAWSANRNILTPNRPADKAVKEFRGFVSATSGAGGEQFTARYATDNSGIGGIWFGRTAGVPTFENISDVQIQPISSTVAWGFNISVISITTTRIKFQARKLDNSGWAGLYGELRMSLNVTGW